MNVENVSDSSKLCLSCGLCCDGTLIGFVSLDEAEIPAVKKVMDIEDEQGHGFFLQPCKKYCDGCTVYEDRPKQCGLFKCGLLQSLEEKRVDFDLAAIHIQSVIELRRAINAGMKELNIELQSPSFYFQMVEMKKLLTSMKSNATLTESYASLLSDLESLITIVNREFGVSFS